MKKILNVPADYVDEMLDGLCAAHSESLRLIGDDRRVVVRAGGPVPGKVAIVTGGGSGHLPVFLGYIGDGLIDGCAVGNVFAGPRVADCQLAMQHCDGGAGVLALYGNYGGDRMNFDMAQEFLELEGKDIASLRVADDVASAPPEQREKRRGVAGLVFVYKVAGARAAAGGSLAEVTAAATKAAGAVRSIGVALTPCIVPESGKPSFEIADDEVEFGMGIHGEPGIWRGKLRSADALADEMLDRLLPELNAARGTRMAVLVNSLGATPAEELYILYRRIAGRLADLGVTPVMPLVGRYATSMEMAGASLSLMPLDAELEALLKAPASCPFWKT
ncbi:PTS-dependent dihydroxyacetone kinase, dihydroxyacetone-binding subunit DhaK [Variovorax sp. PBS-H4]|uniref:dihydroxyacetone kinase subunit DhaK n=1 Tax=Variovorax sp. PBS-H4 TaxID=434008 RepID=UPI001319736A|nr:dihydroxyacetone kinase subunit DhaK [Variovorax sp. PBS-H4]VTU25011.1 PTS-dependent dihydroxyacetone kinase, dihydroxyacetone-binding subunit DhaK [Variovorax sp. PBS-H4]